MFFLFIALQMKAPVDFPLHNRVVSDKKTSKQVEPIRISSGFRQKCGIFFSEVTAKWDWVINVIRPPGLS